MGLINEISDILSQNEHDKMYIYGAIEYMCLGINIMSFCRTWIHHCPLNLRNLK